MLDAATKTFCGGLGRKVALGHCQHLVTDHEFSDRRGTEKRRKKMSVEVPFPMCFTVGGPLVKTHRVRKWNGENLVVSGDELRQNARKIGPLHVAELVE